jgi:hypothetical protein
MAQAPERIGRGATGRGARGGRRRPNQLQAAIEGEAEEPPLAPAAPEPGFLATLVAFRFYPDAIQGLTNNGLLSTHDLIGLTARDIEKIMKIIRIGPPVVVVPYLAEKNLTILTYWVNRRNRLQESINPILFDAEELEASSKLMNAEAKDKDDSDVKPPEKFKVTSKWKPFKEGVIAYFNSITMRDFIPLSYVIREQETPDPRAQNDSEHQRLVAIAPLQGFDFNTDNGQVFDHLKSRTLEGPAWTWMRQYNK